MTVIWHIKGRYVDLKVGAATVIEGALGALLGVRIAFSVDIELLHRPFGLLLLIIGISQFFAGRERSKPNDKKATVS